MKTFGVCFEPSRSNYPNEVCSLFVNDDAPVWAQERRGLASLSFTICSDHAACACFRCRLLGLHRFAVVARMQF